MTVMPGNAGNLAGFRGPREVLTSYADLLGEAIGHSVPGRRALSLLRGPWPDERDARLDSHARLLKAHLDRVADALTALPGSAIAALPVPAPVTGKPGKPGNAVKAGKESLGATGTDSVVDDLAAWLIARLEPWPVAARRLAVATARLVEDGAVLEPAARRLRPLGRGFEELFDERLRRRFALIPERLDYLDALRQCLPWLMEEPDHGAAEMERVLGTPLAADDRAWLEAERLVAMLRFVRHSKTEESSIRWFLRKDDRDRVVLDRFGVHGHWIIQGEGNSAVMAKLGTAVERVMPAPPPSSQGWRLVTAAAATGESTGIPVDVTYVLAEPLEPSATTSSARSHVRRSTTVIECAGTAVPAFAFKRQQTIPAPHRSFTVRGTVDGLTLWEQAADKTVVLASVGHQQTDDELLDFLDAVDRAADLSVPADEIDEIDCQYQPSPAVEWTRALLRRRALPSGGGPQKIRLVYVPAALQHPLGGVPLVGLAFLQDRMERLGARVHVLTIPPTEFWRRSGELLGADVIGIGVYIHNYQQVGELVARLRQDGYRGKIILGGPQLRDIDLVQESIPGWDALIRGEAEDALPQVLEVLGHLDAGRWAQAFRLARAMTGVAIRYGDVLLLCETAMKNRAARIACPLPFDWMRGKTDRKLQMNFTRGCPYLCTFCPNHQGQLYRSGAVEELWQFTTLAVADDMPLPTGIELATARLIQDEFNVAGHPRLRVALHLLLRYPCRADEFRALLAPVLAAVDPAVTADPAELFRLTGMPDTVSLRLSVQGPIPPWQMKRAWLTVKLALLASRRKWQHAGQHPGLLDQMERAAKPAFALITSEDNTLVNRKEIRDYLERRIQYGLDSYVIFNPGQNTIWDLTDKAGGADEDYIADLVRQNPFAVALGIDGTSNPVIRQNRKPRYGVSEAMAVNRALARHGVVVANNYILLTPETDLLEAVEAFVLVLLLPLPWRDYGHSVNLRVIKEEGTLAHDEGLIFARDDDGWDEPMRFPELKALLERWDLTSNVASSELPALLWKILQEDESVAPLLPLVVERWLRDFDSDPELLALGRLISAKQKGEASLAPILKAVQHQLAREFPGEV